MGRLACSLSVQMGQNDVPHLSTHWDAVDHSVERSERLVAEETVDRLLERLGFAASSQGVELNDTFEPARTVPEAAAGCSTPQAAPRTTGAHASLQPCPTRRPT